MAKWPSIEVFQRWLGGRKIDPNLWGWMMGFPDGWLELRPLERHKFRQWCALHGVSWEESELPR